MEKEFWHRRWEAREIGFHASVPNGLLVKHFSALGLALGARLFLPLCGKTLDIGWLLRRGYRVVGVELSELAIDELFDQLGQEPEVSEAGAFKKFSLANLDIYCGDLFEMTAEMLGAVDGIYDRAALIAMPSQMRGRYCAHLIEISGCVQQLLISLEYEPSLLEGPPFTIPAEEVAAHYQGHYDIRPLASFPVPNGLKGKYPAVDHVFHLQPK